MKRNTPVFITLLVLALIIIFCTFFPFIMLFFLVVPDIGSDKKYADPANYVNFDATIEKIDISDDGVNIRLKHDQTRFYESFVINGENYKIAANNGVAVILIEGATISISVLSDDLDDSWSCPIAYLSYDGTEYLPFEVGYKNIAARKKQASNTGIKVLSILGSVLLLGITLLTVDLVVYIKATPAEKEPNAA